VQLCVSRRDALRLPPARLRGATVKGFVRAAQHGARRCPALRQSLARDASPENGGTCRESFPPARVGGVWCGRQQAAYRM